MTNEVPQAAKYAEECGLEQAVIPIYWEDFENYAPILMRHKGAPIHSIEVQIYKAALQAKADGFERIIFGESADCNYGGQSGLMSKDWTLGEFIDRYSYVKPYKVLKDYVMPIDPIIRNTRDGYVDAHEFMRTFFLEESMGSYVNACQCADIDLAAPFSNTYLNVPLDYNKVRSGENKYVVREVFSMLYPDFIQPAKLPMPRALNEWLKNWQGPRRPEFWPHCTDNMTGDQKWYVWCLEKFFNLYDPI